MTTLFALFLQPIQPQSNEREARWQNAASQQDFIRVIALGPLDPSEDLLGGVHTPGFPSLSSGDVLCGVFPALQVLHEPLGEFDGRVVGNP